MADSAEKPLERFVLNLKDPTMMSFPELSLAEVLKDGPKEFEIVVPLWEEEPEGKAPRAAPTEDELERPIAERIVIKPDPVKITRSSIERETASSDAEWLDCLGPWIPKKWREGWLHDILEDREEWRSQGLSRRRIELRTLVQFANAMVFNPGTWFVGAATWVASKVARWPWFGS